MAPSASSKQEAQTMATLEKVEEIDPADENDVKIRNDDAEDDDDDDVEAQKLAQLYKAAKDENELLEFKNYELLFKIQELEQKQRKILENLVQQANVGADRLLLPPPAAASPVVIGQPEEIAGQQQQVGEGNGEVGCKSDAVAAAATLAQSNRKQELNCNYGHCREGYQLGHENMNQTPDDDGDQQNYYTQLAPGRKTNRQIFGSHDVDGSMVSVSGGAVELAAQSGGIDDSMEKQVAAAEGDGKETAASVTTQTIANLATNSGEQSSNSMPAQMILCSTNENGQLIEYNGQWRDSIVEPARRPDGDQWSLRPACRLGGGATTCGSDFDGQKEKEEAEAVKVVISKHDDRIDDAKVDHEASSSHDSSSSNGQQGLATDQRATTHGEQAESQPGSLSSLLSSSFGYESLSISGNSVAMSLPSAANSSSSRSTNESCNGGNHLDLVEDGKMPPKSNQTRPEEAQRKLAKSQPNLQDNHEQQQQQQQLGSSQNDNPPPARTFRRLPVAPSGGARIAVPVARRVQQQQTKQQASRQGANYLRVRSKSSLDQSSSLPRRSSVHDGAASSSRPQTSGSKGDVGTNKPGGKNQASRYGTPMIPTARLQGSANGMITSSSGSLQSSLAKGVGGGSSGQLANGGGVGGSTRSLSSRSYSSMGFVTQIPTLISQSHAPGGHHNHQFQQQNKTAPTTSNNSTALAAPKIPIMIQAPKKLQATSGGYHCNIPKLCGSKSMSNLVSGLANEPGDHHQAAAAAVDTLGANDDIELGAPQGLLAAEQHPMIGGSCLVLSASSSSSNDHQANTNPRDDQRDAGNLAANRDRIIHRSSNSLLPKASSAMLKPPGSKGGFKFSKSMNCVSVMDHGDDDADDNDEPNRNHNHKGEPLFEPRRVDGDEQEEDEQVVVEVRGAECTQQQPLASQVEDKVVGGAGGNNNNDISQQVAAECHQCKLFQSDLDSLIREKKQLNEQISELEELENDSRLMSQNLSQQLSTLEQQLVECKLELEKTCQSEAKLHFQNKKLNFELMQRLESIQQLQCQLTKLQTVRALNANSNCATTTTSATVTFIRNANANGLEEKLMDGSANNGYGDQVESHKRTAADLTRNQTHELHHEAKLMLAKSRDHQQQQQVANLGQVISATSSSQLADSTSASHGNQLGNDHGALYKLVGDIGKQQKHANVSPNRGSLAQEDAAHLDEKPSVAVGAASSSSGANSLQSQQSGAEVDSGLSSFKEVVARHQQDALKTGEDSAYSKSSASSDDGNRSDSDQTSGSPSVEPIVRNLSTSEPSPSFSDPPSSQKQSTALVGNSKPPATMSSSSSGDESDHHESTAFCLTIPGSASLPPVPCSQAISITSSHIISNNMDSSSSSNELQYQQQQQMGQALTGRQQVLRKKISMARILRGVQVQQSAAQVGSGSITTPSITMNKLTHHSRQQDVATNGNNLAPDWNSQARPLVSQARLAQVLPPSDSSGCHDDDRQGPLMEDKDRTLQHHPSNQTDHPINSSSLHQRQQEFISKQQLAGTRSPIDLALGGVYDLEQGRADEHLRSLVDDGCLEQVAGQMKTNTTATSGFPLPPAGSWAARASGQQQQQQQGAEMANLINQFKLEIANLKTRLLQAHTLNDNLVSELKSNKDRSDKLEIHLNGFQRQQPQHHFNQKASTFVGRQQVSSTMGSTTTASLIFEHHHHRRQQQQQQLQHHRPQGSQVDMQNAAGNNNPAGQRSIIYVNGVKASLSQQQQHQAHITATTTGTAGFQAPYNGCCCVAGHHYSSGNNNNNNNNNGNNLLQTACHVGGSSEILEFLKFLLDKIHFHHGRTFELVNECQKLAMQALLASHSHQLNLVHHNNAVLAGNQATQRAGQPPKLVVGQSQSQLQQQQQQQQLKQQQSSIELYPVRPPPRRRTAASRMIPSDEPGLGSGETADKIVEPQKQQQQQPPTAGSSSGRGSTSALQVAKQTLFSIVPIYYNSTSSNNSKKHNNKDTSGCARESENNQPTPVAACVQQEGPAASPKQQQSSSSIYQLSNPSKWLVLNLAGGGRGQARANQSGAGQHDYANHEQAHNVNNNNNQPTTRATNVSVLEINNRASYQHQEDNINHIDQQSLYQNYSTAQTTTSTSTTTTTSTSAAAAAAAAQTAHLIRMKNTLSEDIERYRVRFNGQLLDLLTRQNWCENIITEKLKSYQSMANEQVVRHHGRLQENNHNHHHQQQLTRPMMLAAAAPKADEELNRIQMRDSFASKQLQNNTANMTKSVNVPINSISLNPNGLAQQQQHQQSYNHRQSWPGNRNDHQATTTSSFC